MELVELPSAETCEAWRIWDPARVAPQKAPRKEKKRETERDEGGGNRIQKR